jgi:hypothetical protein
MNEADTHAERIEALEAKCALLGAALRRAEDEVTLMCDRNRIYELECEADRWRWHDLTRDDEQPPDGNLVVATDGKARWLAIFHRGIDIPMTFFDGQESHTATHWHPILEIQAKAP